MVMGLFTKKTDEEIEAERQLKIKKTLEKYGLNLAEYDSHTISEKNVENLSRIGSDLAGNKWLKAGMALSFAKSEEQAKVTYLSAQVEQNWILIRQNEIMIRLLSQLVKRG
jgi:hypothetical protein